MKKSSVVFISILLFGILLGYGCNKSNETELPIETMTFLNENNIFAIEGVPGEEEITISYAIWNDTKNLPEMIMLNTSLMFVNIEYFKENFTRIKNSRGEYLVNAKYIRNYWPFGNEGTNLFFEIPKYYLYPREVLRMLRIKKSELDEEVFVGDIMTTESESELSAKIDLSKVKKNHNKNKPNK